MNDDELTARLRRVADRATGQQPDLVEVEHGAARVRTRRRWMSGVAAAMLVAAAGGAGFGLGRSAGGSDGAADEAIESPDDATSSPTTGPADADVALSTTIPDDDSAVAGPLSSVAVPSGPLGGDSLSLVYERSLSTGVRVRVLLGETWEGSWSPVAGWQPAEWCAPNQDTRITFDGPDLVDVGGVATYSDPTVLPSGVAVQRLDVGWADAHPLRVAVVQAATAGTVTIRWADGSTDSSDVVDGLAVLVVSGADAYAMDYEIDLDGTIVTSSELDGWTETAEWREACQPPPPALPDPGVQPDDPAAAEAALQADFRALWDDIRGDTESSRLDDWTGILDALGTLREGPWADAAASAEHTVDEVSFQSPTAAWFRYSIHTGTGVYRDRYGTAILTDTGWVFPRAVPCADLAMAGAPCDPPAAPIYPPSWYAANGSSGSGECIEQAGGATMCASCEVATDGTESCWEGPPATTTAAP